MPLIHAGGAILSNQGDGLFNAAGEESDPISLDGSFLQVQIDLAGATASIIIWGRLDPAAPWVAVETMTTSTLKTVSTDTGEPLFLTQFKVESDTVSGGAPKVYYLAKG